MQNLTNNSSRALKLEHLEPRLALAGDVVIASDGGNLAIVGDTDSNQIEMQTVNAAGDLAVVGRADTRLVVGGQQIPPNQPILVGAVAGITSITLAAGNDVLIMNGTRLGPTFVGAGAGDDVVVFTAGTIIDGPLSIELGTGNDRFVAHHAIVGAQLSVEGGTGDDHVVLGNTQVGAAVIDLGAGEDRLRIADAYFGQLGVDLGEDADVLILAGARVAGPAVLSGGADRDVLISAGGNHLAHLHVGDFEVVKAWWTAGEA